MPRARHLFVIPMKWPRLVLSAVTLEHFVVPWVGWVSCPYKVYIYCGPLHAAAAAEASYIRGGRVVSSRPYVSRLSKDNAILF